jgi:hypothetical protein
MRMTLPQQDQPRGVPPDAAQPALPERAGRGRPARPRRLG